MMPNIIQMENYTYSPSTMENSSYDEGYTIESTTGYKHAFTNKSDVHFKSYDSMEGAPYYDSSYYDYYGSNYSYEDYRNRSCDPATEGTSGGLPAGYSLCIHILLPIICTIGIVGITLTVIVLSRKNMSTSTNSYLISLAVVDLCFLLTMVSKCLETKLTREQNYTYFLVMTYTHILLNIFLMASVWLTVMLAVERYIAICHPMSAMSICTVKRARFIIIFIFVISLVYRMPQFFKYKVSTINDHCLKKEVLWHVVTELGKNELFRQIYSWADCIILAVLPFSALLFLNSCLIREIHRSTNYLRYHLASDSNVRTIITSEEIKITLMLISVVVVFFICEAPYLILGIIKSLWPDKMFPHFNLITYVTILLLVLRSSFNFILYCWFSEKFWNTFKRTFCRANCIMSRAPSWFRSRMIGTNSEHGLSNNNRKISYFNTKETIC